jgi:hypothetical protein
MNRAKRALALAGLILVTASAAAPLAHAGTEFLAYEGRDAIQEGRGGERKTIDGIDFWMDGAPPHRFQILGSIRDERWESGIIGIIRMSNLGHDIAKRVKELGGDAVILSDSHDNIKGYASSSFGQATYGGGSAFGSSSSFTNAYGSHSSSFVVVKYLPDAPDAGAQPPAEEPSASH